MIEAYYCTFGVYGLYVQKNWATRVATLLLKVPVAGRIFGLW